MVKNKKDLLLTPRRRASLSKKQKILEKAITKVLSHPASATTRNPVANVKVVVRVRPPNIREKDENNRNVVKVVDEQMLIFDPEEEVQGFFFHGVRQKGRDLLKKAKKNMKFYFDKVFTTDSTNEQVYMDSTYSLISSVMDGYNCSVFAYGATGAGKTFTMTGTSSNPGITFLTMTELFKRQEELSLEREFELGITYLEVYNELVKDLLNPGAALNLREDSVYGVIVAGIKVFKINSADELFSLLEQGNQNRTQHPTDANAESSRSHAVFQVYIKMTMKMTNEVRTAKLSMIDLAGSERGAATGYNGARFTEGANINKSLLALGNCINSLADGQRHIPYRDSKLTRLLKDSLGGNCQTIMIANVSPSSLSYEDTYNTLKYATRAKRIKSSACRNVAKLDLNVVNYKLVEDLTRENQVMKQQLKDEKQKNEDEKQKNEMLEKECQRLKLEVETAASFVEVKDNSLITRIKDLMEKKRELLEHQFELEKSEDATVLRRLLKEEIDSRLSDICETTPKKKEERDKINNTILRFKKQEIALRSDIEKTEDDTDEIDKQIDNLLDEHPYCKQYIKIEKMKLALLRAKHRILLEHKHSQTLLEDQEEKTELLEKLAGTIKTYYKMLKGHGFVSSTLAKQYQEITKLFVGRKNIRWGEIPEVGICSESNVCTSELDLGQLDNKRKPNDDPNETFSMPIKQTKSSSEPFMIKGTKTFPRSPAVKKLPFKSSGKPVVNSGVKGNLKSRPTPLTDRPRFRR